MTVDYTKISQQMNNTPSVKTSVAPKDFTKTPNINSVGLDKKKAKNNVPQIMLFLVVSLAVLYFAPFLLFIGTIIIIKNKKANLWFKNFIRTSHIDTTKSSAINHFVEQARENMTPEQKQQMEKFLSEYNIKTID